MPLLTAEIKKFIAERKGVSAEELALQARKRPELPLAFVAQQVKGRSKIEKKLPLWFENEDALFPKSVSLEQCSSEVAARYKASLVEGERAIDLTGGFGVDSRFLCDRFKRVVHVERQVELLEVVSENAKAFGIDEQLECVQGDGLEALDQRSAEWDLIYVDPARRDARSLKVSALEDCEPNLLQCWDELLEKGKLVMAKLSPGLDITRGLEQLRQVFAVHVVSVDNECKEVLFMAKENWSSEARIHCVNMANSDCLDCFEFSFSEERSLEGAYGPLRRYLYEPNASVMKGGGYKSFSKKMAMPLIGQRSRFLSSDIRLESFPGRVFEILDTGNLSAKDAKALFPEKVANVLVRNCGMGAEELKKKLKLRDGGDHFAIGTTDWEDKRVLLKARRIS
ncbi:MAG: SAM-dependent methyltransferase [Symploca sp. SIO2D2]|nr:SAM-dependent methyltransferase [Symploca sp. SIO2D2]